MAEPNVAGLATASVESGHGGPSSRHGIEASFGYATGDEYMTWAGYG